MDTENLRIYTEDVRLHILVLLSVHLPSPFQVQKSSVQNNPVPDEPEMFNFTHPDPATAMSWNTEATPLHPMATQTGISGMYMDIVTCRRLCCCPVVRPVFLLACHRVCAHVWRGIRGQFTPSLYNQTRLASGCHWCRVVVMRQVLPGLFFTGLECTPHTHTLDFSPPPFSFFLFWFFFFFIRERAVLDAFFCRFWTVVFQQQTAPDVVDGPRPGTWLSALVSLSQVPHYSSL